MMGVYYEVIIGGSSTPELLFGTSCSSPVFAAFVSLVNADRYSRNLTSIGFINPTLYMIGSGNITDLKLNASEQAAAAGMYNDITSGTNNCCANDSPSSQPTTCCNSGFAATSGWDPISGWGSVNYNEFSSVFKFKGLLHKFV
jgi:tripeptidyl-peptidase-1